MGRREILVQRFVAECCEASDLRWTSHQTLVTEYRRWLSENEADDDGPGTSGKALTMELHRLGFRSEKTRQGQGFIGLGLRQAVRA